MVAGTCRGGGLARSPTYGVVVVVVVGAAPGKGDPAVRAHAVVKPWSGNRGAPTWGTALAGTDTWEPCVSTDSKSDPDRVCARSSTRRTARACGDGAGSRPSGTTGFRNPRTRSAR